MRTSGWMLCAALAGCGTVNDDGPGDARPDTPPDTATTEGLPPLRCDASQPFGTPVEVAELNSPDDEGAMWLSADETTIYFASSRSGGAGRADIYRATRGSSSGAFGTPVAVMGVNSAAIEQRPILTSDELTMYVETSVAAAAGSWEIGRATRASVGASFGSIAAVPQLNSAVNDTAPFLLPDGSELYFMSDRGAGHALLMARDVGGNWTTPAAVSGSELNEGSVDYPFLSPDGLTLYFSSSRAGGAGDRDLWMATRPTKAVSFDAPINIAALNTATYESGGWVSADGCVLYFLRDAGTAEFNADIYRAERPQ